MVYSFDTTAEQEDAITFKRLEVNKTLARPFETNAAYVAFFVATEVMAPTVADYVETKLKRLADAYRTTTETERRAIEVVAKV
jgi:hypothetical protein